MRIALSTGTGSPDDDERAQLLGGIGIAGGAGVDVEMAQGVLAGRTGLHHDHRTRAGRQEEWSTRTGFSSRLPSRSISQTSWPSSFMSKKASAPRLPSCQICHSPGRALIGGLAVAVQRLRPRVAVDEAGEGEILEHHHPLALAEQLGILLEDEAADDQHARDARADLVVDEGVDVGVVPVQALRVVVGHEHVVAQLLLGLDPDEHVVAVAALRAPRPCRDSGCWSAAARRCSTSAGPIPLTALTRMVSPRRMRSVGAM